VGTVDKHVWRCILNILNNVPLSALMTIPGSELQIVGSVTENALPIAVCACGTTSLGSLPECSN